jgi:hypothetical protein
VQISTHKGGRGGVVSYATVGIRDGISFSFLMFGDFSKAVASYPAGRVTSKIVEEAHAATLASVDSILEEVAAFYSVKEAA